MRDYVIVHMPVVPEQLGVVIRAGRLRAVKIAGEALHHLAGEIPVWTELQPGIQRCHPVGASREVAACDQDANFRIGTQLALNARDPDAGPSSSERGAVTKTLAPTAIRDRPGAQVPPPPLTRKPDSNSPL